jgi:hypothetical protein
MAPRLWRKRRPSGAVPNSMSVRGIWRSHVGKGTIRTASGNVVLARLGRNAPTGLAIARYACPPSARLSSEHWPDMSPFGSSTARGALRSCRHPWQMMRGRPGGPVFSPVRADPVPYPQAISYVLDIRPPSPSIGHAAAQLAKATHLEFLSSRPWIGGPRANCPPNGVDCQAERDCGSQAVS